MHSRFPSSGTMTHFGLCLKTSFEIGRTVRTFVRFPWGFEDISRKIMLLPVVLICAQARARSRLIRVTDDSKTKDKLRNQFVFFYAG